ncbi:T9SS type A sorting domain-containing protein [Chryseobacterium wangxinyae]|uniref:T9SS type A sorting domain-containing protein n=1 Tax=Chryseobacterium sp. CY350 TaxID=2997336 RepID=UPI0022701665|nr:T9SS type A sorting domain-containing protein [Chryseobacterium sp. CY350]MCY0977282.1 T9SS type A sorting domain-containing protein [Chryseobacterium sp. CY350]WBZ95699.1 T9SS type A sorting domain-containing protein [Chryseobacterium sp. CY350]
MKKILLTASLALATIAQAQFSSGIVNLGTTGMTVKLDTTPSLVTLTLTGADNSYLGIGFGNAGMASGSDGFIYNSTANRDYSFNGIGAFPSADSSQDWTEVSNTTSSGIRTVIATRSLSGGTGDIMITNTAGVKNIFFARGGSTTISQHSGTNRGYASLNMTATLGTQDIDLESAKIIFYPNPAKDIVTFKNPEKIESVEIYESTGRKLKSIKLQGNRINISELKNGVYYIEINLNNKTQFIEKLIKN